MHPAPEPGGVDPLATAVITSAIARGVTLATAESLTAGAVVARLVDVPGASACVLGGAACYASTAKARILGVDAAELDRTGAVTASVARQMALGAQRLYDADLVVSTTGVAGPGPDERAVPAGTVHLALADRDGVRDERVLHLAGERSAVRAGTVRAALELLAVGLGLAPGAAPESPRGSSPGPGRPEGSDASP
ncbi:nicotinamide-nucleotide amidohydrolase family protein [Brachybacterium sp. EF45031]|uniref:CinA family protein n=1 Tax=Brachybacterium sillae TaxID=2810536 RepID=UPI00217E2E79|nr:nicotinamide-nucleotide amidohydrolase family protein [Brachybacterium sillae]MCS6712368.1 nicotinamide-nucleotide amidohydrolase family protein [Brachybacterium sillae]